MNQVIPFTGAGRPLPANVDAEKALLGTLLLNNRAYDKVSDYLKPEHFSDEVCGEIYRQIAELIDQGKEANPVTLKTFAETYLVNYGGKQYIASLCALTPIVINAAEYGDIIYDLYLRRNIIQIGTQAVQIAQETDKAERQIDAIEESLFGLTSRTPQTITTLGDAGERAYRNAEVAFKADGKLTGLTTGLVDLDRRIGGMHKSDLIILAGRPGMGKTALATTIAVNAAKACQATGQCVAFFSLEMADEQIATRILSHYTELDSNNIRNGRLAATDFGKLVSAKADMSHLPLLIDDRAGLTVHQIRNASRRLVKKGLALIVIDYIQLINGQKGENRVQEISSITRALKMLAKDLNVPVLALSQLSRSVEQRDDKRPLLSDLRESGSIEQDADIVMFVYREEYYERGREPKDTAKWAEWQENMAKIRNVAEVIVSKQRHGPCGTDFLHFKHETTWFGNLDRGAHPNNQA